MRGLLIADAVVALVIAGCREKPQPAELDTAGATPTQTTATVKKP